LLILEWLNLPIIGITNHTYDISILIIVIVCHVTIYDKMHIEAEPELLTSNTVVVFTTNYYQILPNV